MLFINMVNSWVEWLSPRDPKTARSFSFAQTSPRVNQPWRHRAGNHGILLLTMGQVPAFFSVEISLMTYDRKHVFFDLWFGWLPLIVVPGCCRYEFKSWIALVFAGLSISTFRFFPDVPWEAQTQCVNRVLPKMSHTGSFQLLSMLTLRCFF